MIPDYFGTAAHINGEFRHPFSPKRSALLETTSDGPLCTNVYVAWNARQQKKSQTNCHEQKKKKKNASWWFACSNYRFWSLPSNSSSSSGNRARYYYYCAGKLFSSNTFFFSFCSVGRFFLPYQREGERDVFPARSTPLILQPTHSPLLIYFFCAYKIKSAHPSATEGA